MVIHSANPGVCAGAVEINWSELLQQLTGEEWGSWWQCEFGVALLKREPRSSFDRISYNPIVGRLDDTTEEQPCKTNVLILFPQATCLESLPE